MKLKADIFKGIDNFGDFLEWANHFMLSYKGNGIVYNGNRLKPLAISYNTEKQDSKAEIKVTIEPIICMPALGRNIHGQNVNARTWKHLSDMNFYAKDFYANTKSLSLEKMIVFNHYPVSNVQITLYKKEIFSKALRKIKGKFFEEEEINIWILLDNNHKWKNAMKSLSVIENSPLELFGKKKKKDKSNED